MGGISDFISASLIAVYMFSGWDTGILVNEETSYTREKPGQSVVVSVIVLALMYAFLTFALQCAVHTKNLENNGDTALSYIAQVIAGSALAKYMILAVDLSALGSTLASLVSGVRVTFAMGRGRRAAAPVREDGFEVQDPGPGHGHHRRHRFYGGLSRCSDAVERGCWGR